LDASGGIAVAAAQTLGKAGRTGMGPSAEAVLSEAPAGIAQGIGEPA